MIHQWASTQCLKEWRLVAAFALVSGIHKLRQGVQKIMELNAMVSLCGRFGMTPSDRSKIAVDAPPSTELTRFINSHLPRTPAN
jgi:hypothetical protein